MRYGLPYALSVLGGRVGRFWLYLAVIVVGWLCAK